MRLLWIVFRYEFVRQLGRRAYLIMTIGLPAIGLLLFAGYQVFNTPSTNEAKGSSGIANFSDYDPIGYVDPTDFLTAPQGPPFVGKIIRYPDEEAAQTALTDGVISVYYVLADDYLVTGDVELVMENFTLEIGQQSDLFESFVLSFLLDDESATRLYVRLQNPANITTHRVKLDGVTETRDENTDFWLVYVFSMALFLSTITASGYLMQSVIEERETRMIEIILSSIRPLPLLTGKILAMGLLGFIQIGVWLSTVTWIVTQAAEDTVAQLDVNSTVLGISFICFLGAYALLGTGFAAIGALSNNMREGPQLATFLTLPAITPIWFTSLIVRDPDGTMAVVLSLIPITAPITLVMRAALNSLPTGELILSLVILMISILSMMWIAGRLFRVSSLLADSTPRLRDLPRLLFG